MPHAIMNNVCGEIKEMIKMDSECVQSMLLKLIVQVSAKIPLYCVLLGMF